MADINSVYSGGSVASITVDQAEQHEYAEKATKEFVEQCRRQHDELAKTLEHIQGDRQRTMERLDRYELAIRQRLAMVSAALSSLDQPMQADESEKPRGY